MLEINIDSPATAVVSFISLDVPSQLCIDTIHSPAVVDFPLTLEAPQLHAVLELSDFVSDVDGRGGPEIFELFSPIPRPHLAGKKYIDEDANDGIIGKETVFTQDIDLSKKCRHGIAMAACHLCTETQLRLILQPPILERVTQTDVFPSGLRPCQCHRVEKTAATWIPLSSKIELATFSKSLVTRRRLLSGLTMVA